MDDKIVKGRARSSSKHLTYNRQWRLKRFCNNKNFTLEFIAVVFDVHITAITQFKNKIKNSKCMYQRREKNIINSLSFTQICNRYGVRLGKLWTLTKEFGSKEVALEILLQRRNLKFLV
jgi:hypothetical protein